jgi:hypothetical protein
MSETAEFLDEVTRLKGINDDLASALRVAEFQLRSSRSNQTYTDYVIDRAQQALAQHDKEKA